MFQPRVSRYIDNDDNRDIEKGNIDIVSIMYDDIVDLLYVNEFISLPFLLVIK